MKINRISQFFFSPTHSTEKIVIAIAAGTGVDPLNIIENNLTYPGYDETLIDAQPNDLVIIGGPVYAGRIAITAIERLQKLKFAGNPAVLVAVYGNRNLGDALIDLRETAISIGLRPVAGAAFIGEHSYSTKKFPIAKGRPDNLDKEKARDFGEQVAQKLQSLQSLENMPELTLPGTFPLPERRVIPPSYVDTDAARCIKCGACQLACPTGAVYNKGGYKTTPELCTICCACIKACPKGARIMVSEHVKGLAEKLFQSCADRKEPETFI
ncbi:MAG: 4Fe-4S ferredoxin [Candidatus Riflebacteria bacterium HGW-Riflebacteria-2]|jgi:ferredoxin|nr:MAG: 4Fe-4S ferredoxin [Candidatus Riflebacteria bacterium HGW-Riflebacteria-2]